MNILGFSGSLRETSLNSALLRAAGKLLPVGVTLQVASLSEIPLFGKEALARRDPADITKRSRNLPVPEKKTRRSLCPRFR